MVKDPAGHILISCPSCAREVRFALRELTPSMPCPDCTMPLVIEQLVPAEIRHVLFPKTLVPRGPGAETKQESWQQHGKPLAQPKTWTKPIARIGHEVQTDPDRPRGEWKRRDRPATKPLGPASPASPYRMSVWRRWQREIIGTVLVVLALIAITVWVLRQNG
jgi:hypothetical protein